jgi:flagellar hook-associated protein 3 FlgL
MSTINRVTQRTVAQRSLAGLQGNLARVGKLQDQLSSGKQISRPSDSPSGTASALQLRGDIARNAQWSRNADDGVGWLGQADSTLSGMNISVQKVRELTLLGMNTGSIGPEGREALATEVDQLRASLLTQANQTYLGRPIFGGTTGSPIAYDTTGTYVGNGDLTSNPALQVSRTVGANNSVRVDVSGPEAFGAGAGNVFQTLSDISLHLRTDPTKLGSDLDTITKQGKTLQNSLSDVGARTNRIETARQAADDRGLSLTSSLSNVEDIDLPETIMNLAMANVGYQAALGATAKVIQPSLMDFMR